MRAIKLEYPKFRVVGEVLESDRPWFHSFRADEHDLTASIPESMRCLIFRCTLLCDGSLHTESRYAS